MTKPPFYQKKKKKKKKNTSTEKALVLYYRQSRMGLSLTGAGGKELQKHGSFFFVVGDMGGVSVRDRCGEEELSQRRGFENSGLIFFLGGVCG